MTATGESRDSFAAELTELLAGVHRLVRRRLRGGLTGPRLRGAQIELLRLVAANPDLRVTAAAQELGLAGNSVSTLVNQLTEAGLLVRDTDPSDRRAVRLQATPQAVARLRAWEDQRSAVIGEQLAGLPEDDRAALAAALPALRRLAAQLHKETEGR